MTTLILYKLKPDWLFLPNPQMSLHFSLTSFQPIKYRNWGNEVIPIGEHCLFSGLPIQSSQLDPFHSRERKQKSWNRWILMMEIYDQGTWIWIQGTSCGQWLLSVISLTIWIPRFNGFHHWKPSQFVFCNEDDCCVSGQRSPSSPSLWGEQPPSFRSSSEIQAESW